MAHYVFTADDDGTVPTYKILAVAMNIDEDEAVRISGELAQVHGPVTATPVQAYVPRPVKVGDRVSGAVANTLPRGSAIVCVGTPHGTTGRSPHALIRGDGGYIQPDHTEVPVDENARFEILHVGKTEPNHHGRTP
jgi:hypothetical protein